MKNLHWLKSTGSWLMILVVVIILYQLLYTQFKWWEPAIHRIIHLGLSFTVAFLIVLVVTPKLKTIASRLKRFVLFLLLIVGVGITVQLLIVFPETVKGQLVLPPVEAMISGTIGMILCFALTWWRYGKVFSILTLIAFAYVIFGPYILPEDIQPPQVSFLRLLAWTAGDIVSEQGVYGSLISFMANYMWLLMILGTFLQAFGGMRFIQKIGTLASSRLASGPAMLSVVTSALIGSVTGVTAGNIAITGSFTIPMMKERGYTNEQAGAIEMAASNGGQILPPIMGVTAFIMAEFIGVPYVKVIFYAFIPALLYFFCVGLYVQLQAMKAGYTPVPAKVSGKEILLDAPLFILPFLVLIFLLVEGYTLMFVAFWSIVSIFVIGLISSFLRKRSRIDWKEAKEKLISGTVLACEVTIITGLLGALTAILEMSGLGIMLGVFALKISGGNLFFLLILTGVVCLILGTGLPTIAAYVLVAIVLAPPIVSSGVPLIAAHLFVLVFAVFANLTPPIGYGIIVAQRLAGGSYWGTAGEGLKAAFVIFFLPFLFVYTPAIILQLEGLSLMNIVMHFVIVLTLIPSASFLLCNFCLAKLGLYEKGLFVIGAVSPLLAVALPAQGWLLVIIGVVSCMAGIGLSFRRSKMSRLNSLQGV